MGRDQQGAAKVRAWHGEERARLIIEAVRDYAIFMLDLQGRVESWSPGAERIKGWRADEILGRDFRVFYTPEAVQAGLPERALAEAASTGRHEEEGWRVRKDGSRFWADAIITALRAPDGRLEGFAKVTRDLTERRELEAERLKVVQVAESNQVREEFLAIAAHELKTPLTALHLQIDAALRAVPPGSPALAERLRRAARSVERLGSLAEDLLDVTSLAAGQLSIDRRPVELAAAVAEVAGRLAEAAIHAGCALSVDAPAPVAGCWDPLRIEQLVTHLLANAFRFGAGRPVQVAVEARDGQALLTVRDHGPGVPAEARARIFRRFERAAPSRSHGGLGLGLYLVAEIAAAHGGEVAVDDAPGGGAIFTVRLPLRAPGTAGG